MNSQNAIIESAKAGRLFVYIFFKRAVLLGTICCLLIVTGCEESFQPVSGGDRYIFSIYGYLDASVDTQWVRVTPAREQLEMPPVSPEMQVTLEELGTGINVEMNDSLFLPPDGFNYLNFWTALDIRPGHSYRLKAERPDGAASRVTVTIPEEYPTPDLDIIYDGCQARMYIEGVKYLADAQSVWHLKTNMTGPKQEQIIRFPYRNKAEREYLIPIHTRHEWEQMLDDLDTFQVISREIFIASGGPEWREEITTTSELVFALPERFSNVENGVGYLVGIVSKTIPYGRTYAVDNEGGLRYCPEENPQ